MWNETIRQFVNAVCKMMFENNQQLNFTEITAKCLYYLAPDEILRSENESIVIATPGEVFKSYET